MDSVVQNSVLKGLSRACTEQDSAITPRLEFAASPDSAAQPGAPTAPGDSTAHPVSLCPLLKSSVHSCRRTLLQLQPFCSLLFSLNKQPEAQRVCSLFPCVFDQAQSTQGSSPVPDQQRLLEHPGPSGLPVPPGRTPHLHPAHLCAPSAPTAGSAAQHSSQPRAGTQQTLRK